MSVLKACGQRRGNSAGKRSGLVKKRTAWIAPPATRELRELVRHRAKLVGLRSHCKAEVHAVLAKCGVQVVMSDLFGVAGTQLLDRLDLPSPYRAPHQLCRPCRGEGGSAVAFAGLYPAFACG